MQKETIRQKKIGELIQNELASVFIKIGPEIYPNVMFTIMKVRMSQLLMMELGVKRKTLMIKT